VEYAIHPRFIDIMKEKSFAGDDPDEDPYNHLHFFTELCWTIKLREYSDDELKLKLFSQSLTNTHCLGIELVLQRILILGRIS
jgi:hypothetical protein